MIGPLQLWRVMAWIGAKWRSLKARKEEGSGGWRDKTPAVGWGVCGWGDGTNCADTKIAMLAIFSETGAIQPKTAPSLQFQT